MTLLIVDDEFYSVENLRNKLDWAAFGFEQVLCAYSMAQAQELFKGRKIDVALCDIEMPQGSGLDLLEWMRNQEIRTECIFLTCYAEFRYASRALRLGSSDYLLKPVEEDALLAAVNRAIERVRLQEAQRINALHAEYWESSSVQRAGLFWFSLVTDRINQARSDISRELLHHHLPAVIMEQTFFPVLLDCVPTGEASKWEASLYGYAVKNIIRELFLTELGKHGTIVTLNRRQYLIILCAAGDRSAVINRCEQALSPLFAALPGYFRFFVNGDCPIEKVASVSAGLVQAAKENVVQKNAVLDIAAQDTAVGAPVSIPAERWGDLLIEQRREELEREVRMFLHRLSQQDDTRRRDLTHFYHDFSQVLYTQLERSGAAAHDLFSDPKLESLAENACDSIRDMEQWTGAVLDAYMGHIDTARREGTVIENICQYIREHLADELGRGELAAAVYLSPDYLSHLFSEKMGMSLTAYITNERIRHAKELLMQDRLSVRDIAIASGFQNISYFSKQFKRVVGVTPQEFRKRGL